MATRAHYTCKRSHLAMQDRSWNLQIDCYLLKIDGVGFERLASGEPLPQWSPTYIFFKSNCHDKKLLLCVYFCINRFWGYHYKHNFVYLFRNRHWHLILRQFLVSCQQDDTGPESTDPKWIMGSNHLMVVRLEQFVRTFKGCRSPDNKFVGKSLKSRVKFHFCLKCW